MKEKMRENKKSYSSSNRVCHENISLADKLLNLRYEKGLTQEDFAKKIGVTRQAVSRWEMGISTPNFKTLNKICVEFDVSADKFLENCFQKEDYNRGVPVMGIDKILIACALIMYSILFPMSTAQGYIDHAVFNASYTNQHHYIFNFPLVVVFVLATLFLLTGIYMYIMENIEGGYINREISCIKLNFILIFFSTIGYILLPPLAKIQQLCEKLVYDEAYISSFRYIFTYPLLYFLIMITLILLYGVYLTRLKKEVKNVKSNIKKKNH